MAGQFSSPPSPKSVHVPTAPSTVSTNNAHFHQERHFIGPVPTAIAAPQLRRTERVFHALTRRNTSTSSNEQQGEDISDERLWRFIVRTKSRPDDWAHDVDPSRREELIKRVKQSAWYKLDHQNKKSHKIQKTKWTGDSFEIGKDILGNNVIIDAPSAKHNMSSSIRPSPLQIHPSTLSVPSSTAQTGTSTSFKTAVTHQPHPSSQSIPGSSTAHGLASISAPDLVASEPDGRTSYESESQPAKSDTALLSHKKGQGLDPVTTPSQVTEVSNTPSHKAKAKASVLRSAFRRARPNPADDDRTARNRNVMFAHDSNTLDIAQTEAPVPPQEVLARRQSQGQLNDTSAGATTLIPPPSPSDVVIQDRMLVQVSYTRSSGLPIYDERTSQRLPDIQGKEWCEYLVTWNNQRIEIHESRANPGKAWLVGTKKLVYTIPLVRSTHLSLYSFVDMSFCLACPAVSKGEPSRFHRDLTGTTLFIFKCKTRSRAVDWIWQLWRELGGDIPSTIDIQVPVLGTRVTLEVPQLDVGEGFEGYGSLTPQRILSVCQEALGSFPSYESLIQAEIERGAQLGLAWHRGMNLDWVWLESDVNGSRRDWAVLYGLALKQGHKPVQLELRIASHAPSDARLGDGTTLTEPPAVEGYLYRIKPKSQKRSNIYLSSHDGSLFSVSYSAAHPPPVPQAPDIDTSEDGQSENIDQPASLTDTPGYTRGQEIRRGAEQILHALGYIDIRDIVAVRRASGALAPTDEPMADGPSVAIGEGTLPFGHIEHDEDVEAEDDEEDPGGDDHLDSFNDRAKLRIQRSFEVVMRSGAVIRFEAHSVANVHEWIRKLRVLARYWTRRHRVDARNEMDLVHLSTGKPRFEVPRQGTSHPQGHAIPPTIPDPQAAAQSLGKFWTWCVLNQCRPIVKAGRLYSKNRPRKLYRHVYMILIPGHLSLFHVTASKVGYHSKARTINLVDAFVYSGVLATTQLPAQFESMAPRRYQDGLETNDSDVDTTFVVSYRANPLGWDDPSITTDLADPTSVASPKVSNPNDIPKLNSKRAALILKARSKLERDAWCWAINTELERLVRVTKEREQRMRGSI